MEGARMGFLFWFRKKKKKIKRKFLIFRRLHPQHGTQSHTQNFSGKQWKQLLSLNSFAGIWCFWHSVLIGLNQPSSNVPWLCHTNLQNPAVTKAAQTTLSRTGLVSCQPRAQFHWPLLPPAPSPAPRSWAGASEKRRNQQREAGPCQLLPLAAFGVPAWPSPEAWPAPGMSPLHLFGSYTASLINFSN